MGQFLDDWFATDAPFAECPDLVCLAEVDGGRSLVAAAFREAVIDHLVGVELVERLIGKPTALAAQAARLPKSPRQMSADFGEILATEFVDQCTDYRVPVRRLRFKADRELPMPGDDIVALAVDGSPRLLKGEAKSRVAMNASTVEGADKALNRDDGRPKPETLAFLSGRLRDGDMDDLAEVVEGFLDGQLDEQIEHLLFAVSANDSRDLLKPYAASARANIRRRVAGVVIADHSDFIRGTFDALRGELVARGA